MATFDSNISKGGLRDTFAGDFNKPRITPYNPNSKTITLDDSVDASGPDEDIPQFQRSTEMTDRFLKAIDEQPKRKPTHWGRRLLAVGAALSRDPALVKGVIDAPYNREMEEWGVRTGMLKEAASQERMINNQELQDYYRNLLAEDRDADRKERNRHNVETETAANRRVADAENRTKISEARLEVERIKAKGGQIVTDRNGKFRVLYRDGTDAEYKGFEGLSKEDLADIQKENRIEIINHEDDLRKIRDRQQQEYELEQIEARARARATADNSPSANDRRTAMKNRADEYLRANPGDKKYVKYGDDGDIQIKMPYSGILSTIDADEALTIYNRIRTAIDPDYKGPVSVGASSGTIKPGEKPGETSTTAPKTETPVTAPKRENNKPIKTKGGKRPDNPMVGDEHTFDNGNVGRWDGRVWVPVVIKTR